MMVITLKAAINDGLNLIVKNKIIFVPILISIALSSIFSVYYYSTYPIFVDGIPNTATLPLSHSIVSIALLILHIIFYLSSIHLAYSVVKKKVSLKDSINVGIKTIVKFILSSILYVLIFFGGAILFILPGIYLAIRLMFYQYALVIDGESIVGSLKKSWNITRKRWWLTFGISLVMVLIMLAVLIPIYAVSFSQPDKIVANVIPVSVVVNLISVFFTTWGLASYTIAYLKFKK